MQISELKQRPNITQKYFIREYEFYSRLIVELKKRELPDEIVNTINQDIAELNAISEPLKVLRKQIQKKQQVLLERLEKELKLVPKGYYRNKWMTLGIAIGLPFGTAFGAALGNMAFLGIGLPIGLAIGLAIGGEKDKKAAAEGLQLDVEVLEN